MKVTIMLKNILTPALIALTLAGGAHAAQPATNAQLAGLAGVAADQYSNDELQAILAAQKDHDTATLNYYLTGKNRAATAATDASGQLANLAGVQPGAYSASELTLIINARKEHNRDGVAYVLSGTNRAGAASTGTVTAGSAQLAAALGVEASQYSAAQLVAMTAAAND